ncbi:MAG: agarase [Pseudolabrys sp.]
MNAQGPRTRWGGLADGTFEPGGFFRVAERDGVFWLVDPDDGRFLSKGVNTVRFDQDAIQNTTRVPYADACRAKYGSEETWRAAAAKRLAGWGFNTIGAWSDEAVASAGPVLAVTPNLDLGMTFAWQTNDANPNLPRQDFPDVFDPAFAAHVRQRARDLCAARADEPRIVGWFIDNELRWGPDWRGPDELLTLFLNLSPATPGRHAAIELLRERHGEFAAFSSMWKTPARSWEELAALPRVSPPYPRKPPYQRDATEEDAANRADPARAAFAADCDAFLALLAERYFALTAAAIRAADGNHLVLGSRFAFPPPREVIEACARHADVISFNCYGPDPNGALDAYAFTGKPCLLGEFSFRATDSGLPNTNGAGPLVANQTERAESFRTYVTAGLRRRALVGYHWFEHADQPAEGRFDGENSNFGTVTINDEIYEALTREMTALNAEAEQLHAAAMI